MNKTRAQELIRLYRGSLLDDIIPFWASRCVDKEYGGYLTCLDRQGAVYETNKGGWLHGRIPWCFARIYNQVERRPEWLEIARHGLDFVMKHGFAPDGRMYSRWDRAGQPIGPPRDLYNEAFFIMGLAEYAKASGQDWAREKAIALFDLFMDYYLSGKYLDPAKFPPGGRPKEHGMRMILLALCPVIRQVDARPRYNEIMDTCIAEIFNEFWHPGFRMVREFIGAQDETYTPVINIGHGIETAWFIMQEGLHRNDAALMRKPLEIIGGHLQNGWDAERGGLYTFIDGSTKSTRPPEGPGWFGAKGWEQKHWWSQVEALYATLLAYHVTREEKWERWHETISGYVFRTYPDREFGEWFGYLAHDNTVVNPVKGDHSKGPFHLTRGLLFAWKLLEEKILPTLGRIAMPCPP